MRLVVDASVVVKWLVQEEDTESADRLLQGSHELHAPHLLASEVANALWHKVRKGEIAHGDAGMLAAAVAEMPLHWFDDEQICTDSTRLALGHRIGATLVTADTRFANSVKVAQHGGAVATLADFTTDWA